MDSDVMEILNTFEYVEKIPGWQIVILVIFGITLIFFEVFFACQEQWSRSWACAFGAFIFFALALALSQAKKVETRYERAIDDTASFIEIMENYDVVDRRGDIWILKDKDDT